MEENLFLVNDNATVQYVTNILLNEELFSSKTWKWEEDVIDEYESNSFI